MAAQLKRDISRQLSTVSLKGGKMSFRRQASLNHRLTSVIRFSLGRQSSMDPHRRSSADQELSVPENLDSTMQLLFMASRGDANGVEELLREGIDVNSIDLDGRTALHIAACEGHVDVVRLLLRSRANIDARDRWRSTAAADAKYYGNDEVYNLLKARGAKVPRTKRTPMAVSNPREVPEYELKPGELQFRRGEEIREGTYQLAKWNGTKVSVKILDKESYSDTESINAFKHELTLLEKVRHPNVVRFVGAVTQNMPMMIVSEYHPKGLYMAPEVYKDETFDKSVDSFSFGLILYEMIEGAPPFHPKPPKDVARMICLEGMRPSLKHKSKSYPPELKELVEECWDPQPVVRPTFSEIIVRLDKLYANCGKHGRWKDTFKLPWK